jgi:quercetin dioxygenase-like cupin family protein
MLISIPGRLDNGKEVATHKRWAISLRGAKKMTAEDNDVGVVDVGALARQPSDRQPLWAYQGTDLNVNLLAWNTGDGVAEHRNAEVDVLIVCIEGRGIITVEDVDYPLQTGQVLIIPKGMRRAIRGTSDRFAYLTCHRRRSGLWPDGVPRPHAASSPSVEGRPATLRATHIGPSGRPTAVQRWPSPSRPAPTGRRLRCRPSSMDPSQSSRIGDQLASVPLPQT